MIGNSNDEIKFPHELLLTNRQVAKLRKDFENNSSTDIRVSKAQLSNMTQPNGFLGRLLGPLRKTGLPLLKNWIKLLSKSALIPLVLTAAALAAGAGIGKKILGLGTTTRIISNDEMQDILKIAKSLEDSGLSLKGVSETIQNEVKNKKEGFLLCC